MIDFDEIDTWWNDLSLLLGSNVTEEIKEKLKKSNAEYIEDVVNILFCLADREKIIELTKNWLMKNTIVAYHGSRLSDEEILSIKREGIIPLNGEDRIKRISRVLSKDPSWMNMKDKLTESIHAHTKQFIAGKREGQVHATLSRAGLINEFNHYLEYGSEFDQRVVVHLIGKRGLDLLKQDGSPVLIQLAIPGNIALSAAHPFFPMEMIKAKNEIQNIVKEFITAWAYKIKNKTYQSKTANIDCGMVFFDKISPSWIIDMTVIKM